jgi:hypothetical protein
MTTQGQHPHQIGEGKISEANLRSDKAWMTKMIKLGHDENIVNFIVYTCLPKGHPERLTKVAAGRKFFPDTAMGTVMQRVSNALLDGKDGNGFLCQLFWGHIADELKKNINEVKMQKEAVKGTKARRSKEEKEAMKEAKRIDAEFRAKHNLNSRGRIPEKLLAELKVVREKHRQVKETVTIPA